VIKNFGFLCVSVLPEGDRDVVPNGLGKEGTLFLAVENDGASALMERGGTLSPYIEFK
jgi:hypothetical protein